MGHADAGHGQADQGPAGQGPAGQGAGGPAGGAPPPGRRTGEADVAYASAPDDLVLHGVRVLGFPTAARVAGRYGLEAGPTGETLLDFEARGWVRQLSFGGTAGWSLTEIGRIENERRL